MSSRVLTPANQITLLRLLFVPVFVMLVIEGKNRAALAVFVAAAISDVVDGTVARLLHQESQVGVALDPIADKILMTSGYIVLAERGLLPAWLAILVISRDVAMVLTALIISLVAGYRPFRPTVLGKLSTASQVLTLFAAMARAAGTPYITTGCINVLVVCAAVLTAVSGLHYLATVRTRSGIQSQPTKPDSQISD
jgi:cardiolipin synthase (CMP-forming)